jgi:hypothetical protein
MNSSGNKGRKEGRKEETKRTKEEFFERKKNSTEE